MAFDVLGESDDIDSYFQSLKEEFGLDVRHVGSAYFFLDPSGQPIGEAYSDDEADTWLDGFFAGLRYSKQWRRR